MKSLQSERPMTDALRNALDKLPALFVQNANAMMLRMIARMQSELQRSSSVSNSAYLGLLLNMSKSDLAVKFEQAVSAAMAKPKEEGFSFSGGLTLELDLQSDDPAEVLMQESGTAFRKLEAKGRSVGSTHMQRFGGNTFLACFLDAMDRARIGAADAQALTPFARSALNAELLSIYKKLDHL
jgi:hypothetical protein